MPSLKVKDEMLLAFRGDEDSKKIETEKRRKIVWNTMGEADIFISRVHLGYNAFFVIMDAEQMERALMNEVRERFQRKQLVIITPPESNAWKTVVIRNLDRNIDNYDEEEIMQDIMKYNEWAKVEEIHKFRTTSKMIKVRMSTTQMAQQALKNGIRILHQAIPPRDIEKEMFVKITPCYNCFAYDHLTKDCSVEKMTLCAKCAGNNHIQRDCVAVTEKCINCKGNHRTLAAKCPTRKEIQKNKGKELRDRSRSQNKKKTATYAEKTKQTEQQGKQTQSQTTNATEVPVNFGGQAGLPDNYPVIIMSAIAYAHYMEVFFPGTFQEHIEQMYTINGMTAVKFPTNIKTDGMKEYFEKARDLNVSTEPNESIESEPDPILLEQARRDLEEERNQLEKEKKEIEDAKNRMEVEEETNKRLREETPEKEEERYAHDEWRMITKKAKEQQTTPKEQRTESRKEIVQSETKGAITKETKKRITSAGSSKEETIDLKKIGIELFVPHSASYINTTTQQGKERIIQLFNITKAKVTWRHPDVTYLMIQNALCRESGKAKELIHHIKYTRISDEQYDKLKERDLSKQKLK